MGHGLKYFTFQQEGLLKLMGSRKATLWQPPWKIQARYKHLKMSAKIPLFDVTRAVWTSHIWAIAPCISQLTVFWWVLWFKWYFTYSQICENDPWSTAVYKDIEKHLNQLHLSEMWCFFFFSVITSQTNLSQERGFKKPALGHINPFIVITARFNKGNNINLLQTQNIQYTIKHCTVLPAVCWCSFKGIKTYENNMQVRYTRHVFIRVKRRNTDSTTATAIHQCLNKLINVLLKISI